MDRRYREIYKVCALTSDVFWVLVAWVGAYYLRFNSSLPVPKGVPEQEVYLKLIPFIVVVWVGAFSLLGLYQLPGRVGEGRRRRAKIVQGCFFAMVAFIALTYFYEEYKYSRVTLAIFAALHPLAVILGRKLLDTIFRKNRLGGRARKVLLIGSSSGFSHAYYLLRQSWGSGATPSGAILIGNEEQCAASREFCHSKALSVHAIPENWADFFVANPYESVILAIPYQSYQFIEDNLAAIADQVVDIKLIPDLRRFTKFSTSVDIIDATPVIHIHDSPLQGSGRIIKRVFDLVGGLAALLLFAPVMALVAILVKLTSPGPILYHQKRMGIDGQEFSIFKFRTMSQAAESTSGAVWATKNDQRTTKLGKILRRTSLDELPQLLNVLRGEMSLVGPRPERPVFVSSFRKNVPGYMLRHKVKAGITGWAQINGWRGNTSIEKRIEYDLYYIQHWSLWFDIKILFLTIFKGFVNPNAY